MARRSLSSSALSLASSLSSRTWGIRSSWEVHCIRGWSEVRRTGWPGTGLREGDQDVSAACSHGSRVMEDVTSFLS